MWLGTTWQKQENRFLLGAGSSYGLGSTGGNSSISLGASNMPSHRHKVDSTSASVSNHYHYSFFLSSFSQGQPALSPTNYPASQGSQFSGSSYKEYGIWGSSTKAHVGKTSDAGGGTTGSFAPYTDYQGNGQSFSIMPPYLVVNIWKRLS